MKIAILGIRGLPSTYGGFESFVGELACRLSARGHHVTVYCRKKLYKNRPGTHQGIHLVYLPCIEHKISSTITHSLLSIVHASTHKADIVFVMTVANGVLGIIPRIFNKRSVLNVDGMDWLRPKWSGFGKRFLRWSAGCGVKFYDKIVTDADEMQRLYARDFGITADYIAYGANIEYSTNPQVVKDYGLEPDNYYLIASRLIPDNNADVILEGFIRSGSKKKLAIAGGADYKGNFKEQRFIDKLKAMANNQVLFLGHVGDERHVIELHCNAYGYIHGHEFGGINPALLKSLGCGNLVLANDTPFNAEVLENGKFGILFRKDSGELSEKIKSIEQFPDKVLAFRNAARERIADMFSWDKITDEYEQLFKALLNNQRSH